MRKRKRGENSLQKEVIDLRQTPEVDYMTAYALLLSLSSGIHLKVMWLPLRFLILSSWGSPLKADLCPCVAPQQWGPVSSQLSSWLPAEPHAAQLL